MKHLKRKSKIAVIIVLLLIALLAYRCGVRIVYAPELDNNWNAISGVAAWFSVIASSMAVWYAVRVADKQNKIELFDRRLNCYNELAKHIEFALYLQKHKDKKEIIKRFRYNFKLLGNIDLEALPSDFINENENALYQFPFIFNGITRFEIYDIYESFLILINSFLQKDSNFEDAKQNTYKLYLDFLKST